MFSCYSRDWSEIKQLFSPQVKFNWNNKTSHPFITRGKNEILIDHHIRSTKNLTWLKPFQTISQNQFSSYGEQTWNYWEEPFEWHIFPLHLSWLCWPAKRECYYEVSQSPNPCQLFLFRHALQYGQTILRKTVVTNLFLEFQNRKTTESQFKG